MKRQFFITMVCLMATVMQAQTDIEGWGQMIGFHIIYLPLLMKRLKDKRVLQYRAPYLSEEDLTEVVLERSQDKNDFLLQYLEHPKDKEKIKQGFIRTDNVHKRSDGKDKATNRFYPLSSKNEELTRIYAQLRPTGMPRNLVTSEW